MGIRHIKFAFAALVGAYALAYLGSPESWHMIDAVNLVVHEAGHTLLAIGGEFIGVLGGSLLQVALPAAFAAYFFKRGDAYAAGVMLAWTGLSLVNVSVYAGDASLMELPLLGGEGVTHDWNYLLSRFGLLDRASEVALSFKAAGAALALAGALLSVRESFAGARRVSASIR